MRVRRAQDEDAGEILTVQRAAFVTEAQLNDNAHLPPLTEQLAEIVTAIRADDVAVVVAEIEGERRRVVGAARATSDPQTGLARIGRVAVAPDLQGSGIGTALVAAAEAAALAAAPALSGFQLFTGATSTSNIRWYERLGYVVDGTDLDHAGIAVVTMRKVVAAR